MATFKVNGITNVIKDWQQAAQKSPQLCRSMLEAGAAEAVTVMKKHIEQSGLIDTHKMIDSVKPTKIKEDGGFGFSCDVYPQGKDKKGVRNAEKAFVNNYGTTGRRKVPATQFFERAVQEMADAVPDAMERVFDESLGG